MKKTIAFSKVKNYGSFYNLIVTIFRRNGVFITVFNFNLTIIEYCPITIKLRKTNTPK
ncbi:hypothetical protein COM24_05975 [Bacillus toyonensis]|uniref:Uncharacterized protein n=2 Tax=Bacillus toyonensis TaxID=155322 RepID=A0A2B5SP73_9BACI|nr:hypothetical protein [Bacillus toyonensis biovar Thuringiensis]PDY50051.1 hypothetical protein CON61_27400 [Bacillus toyonensis]PEA31180.1 hypothetical protein COO13_21450 [Bacillus toyonensis]PED18227.1 hypothetical protein CON63_22045 [Bacillus toyonensis]PEM98116.1 hypothetical protein CN629_01300 [Bacillus toyonensis]